ncbi:tyrosine-type recombinase/integrase [Natroniella acetigena]|uniref:tyrosine-type recombinase/integrase n=1 Tax=Natroniella acetigena TaxID=52004 RepID=UPI00200A9AF0|nr:tyrosine-type recombinase/integrase [Natroniella acetigena]MCK8828409.1 tyrosine-type recombinase/integrase [Natroniella acetigena]
MGNRVEPIRSKKKIGEIKEMLLQKRKWRDYTLFVCGINFGLRIGDLLRLKIKDVVNSDREIKNSFEIIEQKTGKRNTIKINQSARKAIELLLEKTLVERKLGNYVIHNTYDYSKSISRVQAYKLVRKWCRKVKIVEKAIGTHTLRKTWGYHAHQEGISISIIQAKYKHESVKTTHHYLGIEEKAVNAAYNKVNL